MDKKQAFGERFASVSSFIGSVLLVSSLLLGFTAVVSRKVFGSPIAWADEITGFSLVALVFFTLPLVEFNNAHLRVEFIYDRLPAVGKRVVDLMYSSVLYVFAVGMTVASVPVILRNARYGFRAAASGIPYWIVYTTMPIGLIGMALSNALRTRR